MFHLGGGVANLDVGHRVGAALVADEQRVALGEIPGVVGSGHHLDQAAVGGAALSGRDALGDDGALGVLPDVNHLGAGVGLLVVVHQGHRVELSYRVVSLQDDTGVLPSYGRAGLNLGPGYFGVPSCRFAPLGDEVVDPALPFLVSREPVLQGGVFYFGVVKGDQLHHCGVELIGLPCRSGASFKVADIGALFGDDEGALELAGIRLIDAEIGHQLHGAADAFGDVGKRSVAEDSRVEAGIEVVPEWHHGAEVLLHQVGVVLDGFAHGAEDYPGFLQRFPVGGSDGDAVQHGVNRYTGELFLLGQRNAQLIEGLHDLRVHFVQALGCVRPG